MDCSKHDKVIDEITDLKQRLTATEQTVRDGWRVIRKTESRVDSLEAVMAEQRERTNSIFRMLEELTRTIKSIDEKLDDYVKDVRAENKEIERRLNHIEKVAAVSNNNIEWNWKTIMAFGTVITFLVGMIGQIFI